MTIVITTKATPRQLMMFHHTEDGVKGYKLRLGREEVFIEEREADKLARYCLFNTPKPEVEPDPTTEVVAEPTPEPSP